MEQAHSLEMHSAPQQSDDVEHRAPLMHFDVASVLILAMPKRADMNDDVFRSRTISGMNSVRFPLAPGT
jgi:hypothetical protein